MKVNGQMKQELRDELRRRPWGRLLLWVGICSRKFKEGSGLFGNPLVPIQGRNVRQWEFHYVQRSRVESSARAAMARVRDAGLGSRRRGEVQERHEGSGDRRHDRVVASDLPAAAALVERGVNASFLCFECWE